MVLGGWYGMVWYGIVLAYYGRGERNVIVFVRPTTGPNNYGTPSKTKEGLSAASYHRLARMNFSNTADALTYMRSCMIEQCYTKRRFDLTVKANSVRGKGIMNTEAKLGIIWYCMVHGNETIAALWALEHFTA
eukprot:scaffold1340_cov233-Amphora_coffeaeformis.AAC.10